MTAGDARIVGVEAQLTLPLSPTLRIETGGSVTEAMLVRNALGYPLDDRRLPVVPTYSLRGAVSHDLSLGCIDTTLRLNARYLGPARMSFDPALDRRIGNVVETGFEIHATSGAWHAGLSVRNLLGARSNTFAFGNPPRYASSRQYVTQQPTTAMLSLSREL